MRVSANDYICKAVYPYMAAYVSIWKNTVAQVDVVMKSSGRKVRLSLAIPERLRVVYIRVAVSRPWTRLVPLGENLIMTAITSSPPVGADPLGCHVRIYNKRTP